MASKSIYEAVDELPTKNMTTRVLHALDFIAPGQWENIVGFENTIRNVSGETDEALIQKIGERAITLFNDKKQGYQRALWLYSTVDRVDSTLAKLALANTVGEQVRWLSFLHRITPKADNLQALDLSLKLVAELVAFCLINGIPGDSISDFVKALATYSKEAHMRMAALVAIDGVIPLGPDFLGKVANTLKEASPAELEDNQLYRSMRDEIPGANAKEKKALIEENLNATSTWMRDLVRKSSLTPDRLADQLSGVVDMTDRKLDYLAAFLDLTTNYYEHTGTQSLARRLIERAVNEI